MTRCPCGNTARLGEDQCGRCEAAEDARREKSDLFDAMEAASHDIREGPEQRFAEAVVSYLRERY